MSRAGWRAQLEAKLVSASEAVRAVRSGDRVFGQGSAVMPIELVEALFIGASTREAVQAGRADNLPVFLSDVPDLFRSGALPLDVALLNLSAPDAYGYCSLGTAVDVAAAAAQSAQAVVALINSAMPRGSGAAFIHVDRLVTAPTGVTSRGFRTTRPHARV